MLGQIALSLKFAFGCLFNSFYDINLIKQSHRMIALHDNMVWTRLNRSLLLSERVLLSYPEDAGDALRV